VRQPSPRHGTRARGHRGEGGKVRHETLANLKVLPEAAIAAIEATH
jgi:hypothetical protein